MCVSSYSVHFLKFNSNCHSRVVEILQTCSSLSFSPGSSCGAEAPGSVHVRVHPAKITTAGFGSHYSSAILSGKCGSSPAAAQKIHILHQRRWQMKTIIWKWAAFVCVCVCVWIQPTDAPGRGLLLYTASQWRCVCVVHVGGWDQAIAERAPYRLCRLFLLESSNAD